MSKLENALVWLYVKTWDLHGQHVLDQFGLWTFATEDLNEARVIIMGLANPKQNCGNERVEDLKNLIMGKFENGGLDEFRKWSDSLHGQVDESSEASDVEDLSETEQYQESSKIAVLEEKIQSITKVSAFRATCVAGRGGGQSSGLDLNPGTST